MNHAHAPRSATSKSEAEHGKNSEIRRLTEKSLPKPQDEQRLITKQAAGSAISSEGD
jgi:hypothetical protein